MSAPTLLSLPSELRQKIYHHTLNPPVCNPLATRPSDLIPDLSLLLTNRQIYGEARSLPLELYPTGRPYDPSSEPFLSKKSFLRPFQIAALRRFSIFYLYPPHLKHVVGLGAENGYLFGEEGINLDTLTIYADDWLTRETARRWKRSVEKEDPCFNLPRSSRWLMALCGLKGWKMLNVVFGENDLANEYFQRGSFIQPLFEEFRLAICEIDKGKGGPGPSFTIWHKHDEAPFDEKISVFRTSDVHLHGFPQWGKAEAKKLREGTDCVPQPDKLEPAEVQHRWHESVEVGEAGFHVAERYGQPLIGRQGYCATCAPKGA